MCSAANISSAFDLYLAIENDICINFSWGTININLMMYEAAVHIYV